MSSTYELDATVLAGVTAAIFGTSLAVLQLDAVSRLLLSPERLRAKRQLEQRHKLNRAIASSILDIRRHVNAGGEYDASVERNITDLVLEDDEMDTLVEQIVKGGNRKDKSNPTPLIVGMAVDLSLESGSSQEWYLYLAFPLEDQSSLEKGQEVKYGRRVQTPLVKFGMKLADAFDKQLTSTALCFVADASSGLGTRVLGQVLEQCQAGLALIKEPAWMTTLAYLIELKIIPTTKMERILLGLCRMSAWAERETIGNNRTVVFTLPGQSCTANLLPLLQNAFPSERHVFAYDGCVNSVYRGVMMRKNFEPSATTSMPGDITATTPISRLNNIRNYASVLAALPANHADTVETWMSSVDTFLRLKENEAKNGYLPFVCRMGFLMGQTGKLGNGDVDQTELALKNVLQYITGSKSRTLKDEIMDAAKSALLDARDCDPVLLDDKAGKRFTEQQKVLIEACVFAHKGILIGDKTLLDTVQPKTHWSLKAAKKLTSCACCFPGQGEDENEDGDEDEDENIDSSDNAISMSIPGAFTNNESQRSGTRLRTSSGPGRKKETYVDGKTSFAFDPSKFTGLK